TKDYHDIGGNKDMLSITEKIHRLFVSICFTIAPAAAFLIYIPEIRNASIHCGYLLTIPFLLLVCCVFYYIPLLIRLKRKK
ncbi:MAG: hypothetical protein RSB02_05545, partial [Anaerovoracaceae bacterium]